MAEPWPHDGEPVKGEAYRSACRRPFFTDLPDDIDVLPGEAVLLLAHLGPLLKEVMADASGEPAARDEGADGGAPVLRLVRGTAARCRTEEER